MDNVFVGKKGAYEWKWNLKSPFVYLPKEDAVLITRFFIVWRTPEEHAENNSMVGLCHESIHEAICKLIGDKEAEDFDKDDDRFNTFVEEWLGLRMIFTTSKT